MSELYNEHCHFKQRQTLEGSGDYQVFPKLVLRTPFVGKETEINSIVGEVPLKYLNKWKALNGHKRRELLRIHIPGLHPNTYYHLSTQSKESIKRICNAVEGVKDCILFSQPDRADKFPHLKEYKRLIRWAYSKETFCPNGVCIEWKKFSTFVKWKILQSVTPEPERPQDFPGFGINSTLFKLPHFWRRLTPWLILPWMYGVQNKVQMTRVCHLCTSRNQPASTEAKRLDCIDDHSEVICGVFPHVGDNRVTQNRHLAELVGRTILQQERNVDPFGAHVSLVNSASLNSSVSSGGRVAEVRPLFREWLSRIPTEDVHGHTWFGVPYELRAGKAYWLTVCREIEVELPNETTLGESWEKFDLDWENFTYTDPLFGLDDRTGYQLLQWSIEYGIETGYLSGSRIYDEKNPLSIRTPPEIRPSAIGEPGNKARVVTVAPAWLTILLQPMSHLLSQHMLNYPPARCGMTRSDQLYDWVGRWYNRSEPPDIMFLSSDLTTATDYCQFENSYAMLIGFLSGLGEMSTFTEFCARLLCSPRIYLNDKSPNDGLLTTRGVLMGDPGTKIVLTLHNVCASIEAIFRYQWCLEVNDDLSIAQYISIYGSRLISEIPKWVHFVCTGDDHFAVGPEEYLRNITKTHVKNGMMVTESKNFISRRGGFYCEEALCFSHLRPDDIFSCKTTFDNQYYHQTPFVEALKIRLLSPCSKEATGKDETNPAIGKAEALTNALLNINEDFVLFKPLVSARFEYRMESFLPKDWSHRYLPPIYGGLGVPAMHRTEQSLINLISALPELHQRAIWTVLNKRDSPFIRRVLGSFVANARMRGVATYEIENQIKGVLLNPELIRVLDTDQFRAHYKPELDEMAWELMPPRQKLKLAHHEDLVTVSEAIKILDRPYMFRDMLYPEISRKHNVDPDRNKNYKLLPWHVRSNNLNTDLGEVSEHIAEIPSDKDRSDLTKDIVVKIVKGLRPFANPDTFFIPRSVVQTPDLCTLSTKDLTKNRLPLTDDQKVRVGCYAFDFSKSYTQFDISFTESLKGIERLVSGRFHFGHVADSNRIKILNDYSPQLGEIAARNVHRTRIHRGTSLYLD